MPVPGLEEGRVVATIPVLVPEGALLVEDENEVPAPDAVTLDDDGLRMEELLDIPVLDGRAERVPAFRRLLVDL